MDCLLNMSHQPAMSQTQTQTQSDSPPATLDPGEVERFQRMADDWWNPNGQFKPLHSLTPTRIGYLRDTMKGHFGREGQTDRPLAGLRVLDIGCGGGLVAEPLTRLGAQVTGIDPGSDTIASARAHAEPQGLVIDYRIATIEQIAANGETFDCVTCLEVVEHVLDVGAFLGSAATVVRPGGLLIVSTLNRTLKSYGLAIIGAEYILGWLPRGTHDWNRFVTPDEMAIYLKRAGVGVPKFTGLVLDPLRDEWRVSSDTGVNYFAAGVK
jgi:2-polyprenyl-6-hydroxyphenyl methylase / 3-demethylubiquinone-9 3-methyltransferase